ncbi:SIMPL domain-containing protein [Aeromicrobium marinum]|uniref:SIMPL domain-containing protein n=1 Tax=Aeromicrobium marinum TaxID=219314 RepID=UPI00058B1A45|nr:SIMPL domain-containing protein [Aeromicrobium marinum]
MSLEITVRGSARASHQPDRAALHLAAVTDGPDRADVLARAAAVQAEIGGHLRELAGLRAVTTWSSDQVRAFGHRPWGDAGERLPPVQTAHVDVEAEFVDFERMAGFIDHWASQDGVEIGSITWDVAAADRRSYEAEVRRAAVEDAVVKAQAYADAVRRGRVVAVHLADPDMLGGASGPVSPLMARMAESVDQGLTIRPRPVVIEVAVDAVFRAE